jgi:hypothetical protein
MRLAVSRAAVIYTAVTGLLCVSGIAPAFARPVNLSVGVSTLGLGVQVSTPLIPGSLDLALGINRYSYSHSGTYTSGGSNIPYHGNLRLQTIPVLLNYYPFHGVFRVTGGVMFNQNQFTLNASGGSGNYTINNHPYTAQQVGTFTGKVAWKRVAPYLGLGWGSKAARKPGFSMGFDLGVLFTGSPQVTLSASNPQNNATLASDVAAAQATANQKASSYKLWPVIGVRLGYDF